MPTLALNTAGLTVEGTERAVRLALASGITHVDFHPGTERDGVARALRSAGRQNMFLTTKIRKAPPGTSPAAAAERLRARGRRIKRPVDMAAAPTTAVRQRGKEGLCGVCAWMRLVM